MQARAGWFAFVLVVSSVFGCGSGDPSPGDSDGGVDASSVDAGGSADAAAGADSATDAPSTSTADATPDAPPDGGPPSPSTEFATSFEPADPQPTWASTVETNASGQPRASGVTAPTTGVPGNIMDQVAAITANDDNPPGETAASIGDGELTTKWLIFAATGWVQVTLTQPIAVKRYTISSANDVPERDPRNWTLEGSQDGLAWTVIDTRTDQSFADRFTTLRYEIANTTAYLHYRLNVSANHGATILQVSELELSNGDDTAPDASPMKTLVGRGPGGSWNARISAGFTGVRAFRYAGTVTSAGRGYSYNKVFDVNVQVTAASELSYLIFADEAVLDTRYPGTFAAVDLAFDDGSYLSDLGAVDQHFAPVSPQGQGASRTLYAGEWNRKVSRIGAVAAGKTIKRILVGYDNPGGPVASFGGWIDDLRITGNPVHPVPARLSDHVLTTRGTLSSGGYSRGNNFPATAVPHGFNFWTPVSDAESDNWLYHYHRLNNVDNLPTLQALSLSHETSPWMGDRQSFQVMPSDKPTPTANRADRALPFRHENEVARAHYYGVTFENGIRAEITPTDHAALFRFTFPGNDASLVFDNVDNQGGLTLDAGNREVTGFCDAKSGLSTGATRIFVYATFDKPVAANGPLTGGGGANVTGYFRFTVTPADRTVTMRIATSLISVAQARKNLELEIAATDSFEAVKERAQRLWDDKLGIIQVEGANADQLTTLYSNMYRLFLYPNSGFENTGTAQAPVYQYASPVSPATGTNTPTQTGARIATGKLYVNNGFWDTYRSTWPAYSLLTPTQAGEMIDGFVQQYKDGGWVSRWSSPGYADLMTGTSSDVAFADAFVKGVANFDVEAAYDAALKNATVLPAHGGVGRKGLGTSIFLGYTSTEMRDGLSWAMAGYLNDFGLANMATALASSPNNPRHQEYVESAEYFLQRAQGYANLFDPSIGFFQGRAFDGSWRLPASGYDPRVWGYDYTETNGWNTVFDAPYDGQGLANLFGGRAAFAAKLDQFFGTPEDATRGGSYGGVIHEMREARDVRMGQLGLSNQPSFHIMYMYNYVGQPAKTQAKVRDALARLFVGSEIGQGYLGDEDNGAMSSWQIFGALGLYPLQVGSPSYTIGSPLFTKATVRLENGATIVIHAPNNSARNVYVQGLKVNGQPYSKTYLPHAVLTRGATLEFDMGPAPSSWGTGVDDAPPSITPGSSRPAPLQDAVTGGQGTPTASDGTDVRALFDNRSTTRVTFASATPSVQVHFAAGQPTVTFYTLTSGAGTGDPTSWSLHGSNDRTTWTQIDQRSGQTFRWRSQTRAFKVATPGAYAYYRLDLTGPTSPALGEVELLTRP